MGKHSTTESFDRGRIVMGIPISSDGEHQNRQQEEFDIPRITAQ
jgi:hypothetical protein